MNLATSKKKKLRRMILDGRQRTVELLCNCSQRRTDAEEQLRGQPEGGALEGLMMRNTEKGGNPFWL